MEGLNSPLSNCYFSINFNIAQFTVPVLVPSEVVTVSRSCSNKLFPYTDASMKGRRGGDLLVIQTKTTAMILNLYSTVLFGMVSTVHLVTNPTSDTTEPLPLTNFKAGKSIWFNVIGLRCCTYYGGIDCSVLVYLLAITCTALRRTYSLSPIALHVYTKA